MKEQSPTVSAFPFRPGRHFLAASRLETREEKESANTQTIVSPLFRLRGQNFAMAEKREREYSHLTKCKWADNVLV
jgi:hypothetical protein